MSNPVIGKLLPSQRLKLARAYADIAAVYREALHVQHEPALESAARINELIARGFEKAVNEPMSWAVSNGFD